VQKYENNLLRAGGYPIQGASILVQTSVGATATIYSDNGVTPAANPLTSDTQGNFSFYAADGVYQIVVSGLGLQTQTVTGIHLEDQLSLDTGTSADAGALSGIEIIPLSRGAGLLQTTLTKIAQFVTSTYAGFLQNGTGATARTLLSKLQESVNLADFAGYDSTGATDSTAALTSAANSLGAPGGVIRFRGVLNISTNYTLPEGVALVGYCQTVGQRRDNAYTSANYVSVIVIDPSVTVTMGNRSVVSNCLVISKVVSQFGSYPLPWADIPTATAGIAAFAGTAFTPSSNTADNRLEEVLIIGFQYAYNGVGTLSNARPVFKRVLGDCTNGIFVSAVYDVGLAENCEFWPFTTTNNPNLVSDPLLMRAGTAFYTENGATWFEWHNCTQYGYAIGHDVNGVRNVRQNQCGSDAPGTSTAIGFQYRGAVNNCINIGATIAGQGNAGIVINTTADGNSTSINVIGANFHGSTSANGYVSVLAGNVSMSSCHFDGNASYGHVNLQNAASLLTMADCTHAGAGSSTPVFGNATALALAQISNPRNIGSFANTVWGQLANFAVKVAVAGSATIGIDGLVANYRTLRLRTSGLDRWWIGADTSAESGSNAGSNFMVQRYSDAGAYIDTPLQINRTNGAISASGTTFSGTVSVSVASGSGVVGVDRPAANYGIVRYRTAGVDRWWAGANVTAESGSNVGSDYAIFRYSDAGSFIGTPLTILRSSGNVGIGATTPTSLLTVAGPVSLQKPSTVTGSAYSQAATDSSLVFNGTATQTLTLLSAASVPGQILYVKNIAAFAVNSASANVVPLVGGAAGTSVLAATAGKWAILQSDGTNWQIMAAN